jgi:hypothetical protein
LDGGWKVSIFAEISSLMDSKKKIFFHVGLGKVASTYLQYKFFPKLKGIYYVARSNFKKHNEIIARTNYQSYLLSLEYDRQLERELKKFAKNHPQASIIILLRRHDSWIASQYRRYVKNGGAFSFEEFIDVDNDTGYWEKSVLQFHDKLLFIEHLFGRKPFVLFHDDLKKDNFAFLDRIAGFVGATYDRRDISTQAFHTSYQEKELKLIRSMKMFTEEPQRHPNKIIHFIRRKMRFLICYMILYPGKLIPDTWVSKGKLIPEGHLEKIQSMYSEDWEKCLEYAKYSTS